MCGISGVYNFNGDKIENSLIKTMNDSLYHRGPDNGDIKIFTNVALAHRRLSIIDISTAANQPMSTKDNRYCIVFNGEVYNFLEIKQELIKQGIEFDTQSDTEVVLKSFQHWGPDCFKKFNGMFALAIFDCVTQNLTLARDPFGIKPLYYYIDQKKFVFASEMKAILTLPDISTTIHKQGLVEAMAAGLQVVSTNVEGIPEILRETDSLMVPPKDPIALREAVLKTLKRSTVEAAKAIEKGRKRAELFRTGERTKQMIKLFEDVLSNKF